MWITLSASKIGEPCYDTYMDSSFRIYLDIRSHNKFEMSDLFMSINLCYES